MDYTKAFIYLKYQITIIYFDSIYLDQQNEMIIQNFRKYSDFTP